MLKFYENRITAMVDWYRTDTTLLGGGGGVPVSVRLMLLGRGTSQFYLRPAGNATLLPNVTSRLEFVLSVENVVTSGAVTRAQFMLALSDVRAVLIPATFYTRTHVSRYTRTYVSRYTRTHVAGTHALMSTGTHALMSAGTHALMSAGTHALMSAGTHALMLVSVDRLCLELFSHHVLYVEVNDDVNQLQVMTTTSLIGPTLLSLNLRALHQRQAYHRGLY